MNFRRLALPLAASLAAAVSLTSASAHTVLKSPTPLSTDDDAKTGPCGCSFAPGATKPCDTTPTVMTLTAGAPLNVTWTETVQHTGKFRVAFSTKTPETATIADLDGGVVWEGDDNNPTAPMDISQSVTVPNTPCELCTLQVRQFMENAAAPYYFTCAAVKIVAPSGTGGMGGMGATSATTGGSTSSAKASSATVGGAGPQYIPEPNDESCAVSAGSSGDTDVAALLPGGVVAAWLVARRLKRKR